MKFLFAVAAIVLLKLAKCDTDLQCVRKAGDDCSKDMLKNVTKPEEIHVCDTSFNLMKCLFAKLSACQQSELAAEGEKILATLNVVCAHGTHFNDQLKEYEKCIIKSMIMSTDCMTEVIEMYKKLIPKRTEEEINELHKKICEKIDETKECGYDKLRVACGKEAEGFYRSINEIGINFHKKVCTAMDNKESLVMLRFGLNN